MSAVPEDLHQLADRYFSLLARCFPVMCASDEFHFLPRAEAAADHYDRLDDLSAETIQDTLAVVEDLGRSFQKFAETSLDPDRRIDGALLQSSAAGFSIAFGRDRLWQCNPLLYLKIAFIGLDHARIKPAREAAERAHRIRSRLAAVPSLLQQAVDQIDRIPASDYQASMDMVRDAGRYLAEDLQHDAAADPDAVAGGDGSPRRLLRFFAVQDTGAGRPGRCCVPGGKPASSFSFEPPDGGDFRTIRF